MVGVKQVLCVLGCVDFVLRLAGVDQARVLRCCGKLLVVLIKSRFVLACLWFLSCKLCGGS